MDGFMSDEKSKIDDLLRRIEELIDIFNIISDDLKSISIELRRSIGGLGSTATGQPREEGKALRSIDDVQRAFPEDLMGMLYFEETDDYIIIRPRQYLGSDNFAKIATIIRDQFGGEYISAGKDSHFKISRRS